MDIQATLKTRRRKNDFEDSCDFVSPGDDSIISQARAIQASTRFGYIAEDILPWPKSTSSVAHGMDSRVHRVD